MSILIKLKESIILLPKYIRDTISIRARGQQNNNVEIYVYIHERDIYYEDYGRYLYLLLRFLTLTKFKVALVKKIGFWDYRRIGNYGRKIYQIENLVIATKLPKNTKNRTFVYDREIQKWTSKTWKKLININFDISLPIPQHNNWVFMPYAMNPSTYSTGQYANIKNLQNTSRKIRLFFAGNVDPTYYSSIQPQSILNDFKIMPRTMVIETVSSYLSNEKIDIKDWQQMELILNSNYRQKCIIIETNKINFNVPQTRWLEALAKSDFFICAPGVTAPLCHNAIESMSVGTIPITNYANWFFPSLEHLKNCIKFDTKEDLIKVLELVMSMEKSQIEQLRTNVIEYCEKYLSCDSFLANTIYSSKSELTVFMNLPINTYLDKINKDSIILN